MPDRETSVANFYESLLTSEMGPTDLTADVDATSPLTSPTLVVIEPDDPDQREVILFNGSFTGTQFATDDIANRYLEGSAAGSGLTHPIGSIVRSAPLAHHIIDLNDRIDARAAEDHAARHAQGGADPLIVMDTVTDSSDGDSAAVDLVKDTYVVKVTLSFTKPAGWGSALIMAWGSGFLDSERHDGASQDTVEGRISIDGNNGVGYRDNHVSTGGFPNTDQFLSYAVQPTHKHTVSGDADIEMAFWFTNAIVSPPQLRGSSLSYIAVRAS